MSNVKMLLDVVNEVKKEAPEDVPNWNSKLAEAKVNLQNQIAKGRLLPRGVEDHPLEHFAFNYSVQRDVRAGHVMNIMKKFDPRVCCPVSAVKRSDGETLYIFDGQHRAVALALLGWTKIPVTIVETDEPAFDAEAFEIVNDSGILRAGTEEIHRCLLHRYKMGEKETETVASLQALTERILEGESFSDLAVEYSQDPGSKSRGGRLSNGIARNAENVDQSFRDALFELKEVGDISDVVRSRFGFHILKLESVTPSRERSFDEVKPALVAEIEKRFRQDAYREHLLTLEPRDGLEIDFDAFDELVESM